nr:ORF1 [Torque teno felis virus]
MAPYRRRPWGWRRYRKRRRWFRGPRQRVRRSRRYKKGSWRRRVRRALRRKKATIRAWEPDSKTKCIISGHTIGLLSNTLVTTNRLFFTLQYKDKVGIWPEGGGVNLRVFNLDFLYTEHRMHRNTWSKSNDGYDLALYLGTKVYLPPSIDYDYAFWWDTDLTSITEPDYFRLHPTMLLGSQHVKIIRNQKTGNNHKTRKVWLKPPANMTNQWMYANELYRMPLFAWGMTLFNWAEPYYRNQNYQLPISDLPANSMYYKDGVTWKPVSQLSSPFNKMVYSPLVDKGTGNLITIMFGQSSKPINEEGRPILYTQDLPYWLSTWGQNIAYNYGLTPQTQGSAAPDTGSTPWAFFISPHWTREFIEGTTTFPPVRTFAFLANNLKIFAKSGYFVQSDIQYRVSIPLMYKSYFKWGGTSMVKQKITQVFAPTNQVSVKNPGTVGDFVIKPHDLRHGIITTEALKRFLRPRRPSDERRPVPWQEYPAWDASEESYDETLKLNVSLLLPLVNRALGRFAASRYV